MYGKMQVKMTSLVKKLTLSSTWVRPLKLWVYSITKKINFWFHGQGLPTKTQFLPVDIHSHKGFIFDGKKKSECRLGT